jgi:hypothetical protein
MKNNLRSYLARAIRAAGFSLAVILTIGAADIAHADEDLGATAGHRGGPWSLQVGFPGGGNPYAPNAAGIWYLVKPNLNFGVNLAMGIDPQTPGTVWNFGIAPAARFYLGSGRLMPYAYADARLAFANGVDPTLDGAGGFGAELFVSGPLSVSAQTGLRIGVIVPATHSPVNLATFTSGIIASLYL